MNNDKDYFTHEELNALYQAIVHALTNPYLSLAVERHRCA